MISITVISKLETRFKVVKIRYQLTLGNVKQDMQALVEEVTE